MAQPSESGPGSGTVAGLLAMADFFLTQNPQQIKEAVHCLLASLSLSPPPRVEARVKLQLGLTLYHHSNNLLEARQALEQAMLLAKSIPGVEQVRFEAASILARIHIEQGYPHNAKKVLKSAMETSHRTPYWHCRLLLQKADVHVCERDVDSLIATLTQAADYAHQVHAPYTRILCLLSKGAHLLIHKQYREAAAILSSSCSLVEEYVGPHATLLKTFYMVIQVTHLLGAGLMKTAKPHLKQLQQCVKLLRKEETNPHVTPTGTLTAESFEWFSKEQTYILVYLVCVMHSVLAGSTDKALSFAKKALDVLANKKDSSPVMTVFQAHLLELIVVSTLIQGNCTQAGEKLQEVVNVCHSHSQLIYSHRAVLHTLLGLYAFATDNDDKSVIQFQTALQHTNSLELKVFININLAVTYLKQGPQKVKELTALMESLQSESVNSLSCKNLKGALSFLKGLHAFNQVKLHEAKRHLRETLSISNNNDLNKLTVCALVVLGQIFLSLGNTKETKDMVGPAFQLSSKIPDMRLQAWAAALLIDLNHATGDKEAEISAMQSLSSIKDNIATDCHAASMSSSHSLIQWTIGDWPVTKSNDPDQMIEEEDKQEEMDDNDGENGEPKVDRTEEMEVTTKGSAPYITGGVPNVLSKSESKTNSPLQKRSDRVPSLSKELFSPSDSGLNGHTPDTVASLNTIVNSPLKGHSSIVHVHRSSQDNPIVIGDNFQRELHHMEEESTVKMSSNPHFVETDPLLVPRPTISSSVQPHCKSQAYSDVPAFSTQTNKTNVHRPVQPSVSSSPQIYHSAKQNQSPSTVALSLSTRNLNPFIHPTPPPSNQSPNIYHSASYQATPPLRSSGSNQPSVHMTPPPSSQSPRPSNLHNPRVSTGMHTPPRHMSPQHQTANVLHSSQSHHQIQIQRLQSPPLNHIGILPPAESVVRSPHSTSFVPSPEIHSGYSSPAGTSAVHKEGQSFGSPTRKPKTNIPHYLPPNQLFAMSEQQQQQQQQQQQKQNQRLLGRTPSLLHQQIQHQQMIDHFQQTRSQPLLTAPHLHQTGYPMSQLNPFPDKLQQYGYAALSPEAILRQKEEQQKMLQHQQHQQQRGHQALTGQMIQCMPNHAGFSMLPSGVLPPNPTAVMSHPMANHLGFLQNLSQQPSRSTLTHPGGTPSIQGHVIQFSDQQHPLMSFPNLHHQPRPPH